MNVLITSAGRRGYIVDYFKEAMGDNGLVHAGNSDPIASALHHADRSVITPLIYDKEYIPFLLEYCRSEHIDILLSLFDVDLMILAKNKCLFEDAGTKVIVSDEKVIDICNDKYKTYEFLREKGYNVPQSFCSMDSAISALKGGSLHYPLIIKPRWGMGSIGIFDADNEDELRIVAPKCRRKIADSYLKYESEIDLEHSVIFQEKLDGQEYGMDVINDLNGDYATHVVRKKIAMRAGETDAAVVIDDNRFNEIAIRLSKSLGHIGNLDVDLFECNGKLYILEMNARFGGGYPFSHAAGINLPGAIKKWINGEKLNDELSVKRYNELCCKEISIVKV